jgi:putative endonuclease
MAGDATRAQRGAYLQGRARMAKQRGDEEQAGTGSGARKTATTATHTDTRARRRLGSGGERLAGSWLEARGYRILGYNWRCAYGELDVIATREADGDGGPEGELVFVEVKTRRGTASGLPEEAITARKRAHLIAAAQTYLEAAGTPERAFRIDVIAVQLAPNGKLLEIRHYEAAVGMDE